MDDLILRSTIERDVRARTPEDYKFVSREVLADPRTRIAFLPHAAGNSSGGGGGALKRPVRPYFSAPEEVFPGVLSTDPRYIKFKKEVAVTFSDRWQPKIDEDGFADATGITRDFSALLSVTGVKMNPSNAPVVDRSTMLNAAGLATDFVKPSHARIAKVLHRVMFGKRKRGAGYHFSAISSTSNPFFEYDVTWKKDMILRLLANAESILTKVERDDLQGLFRDHGMLFMATLVERHQAEGGTGLLEDNFVPKARMVATQEYALSGGKHGSLIQADKSTTLRELYGIDPKDACAMRVRTAYGFAGAVSYFMSCWFAGCRESYYDLGGFTWHHTTPEQIFSKMEDAGAVIGMDVTTMDQLYPSFLLDRHAEWLAEYLDPRFAKLVSWVNYSPYFAPQLGVGLDPYWAGDPRKLSTFNVDVGLSSGRADNPDLGKWYMTFAYLAMMDDLVGDVLSCGGDEEASLLKVLAGKHPRFRLLDMSDDAVIILPKGEDQLANQIRELLADESKPASPYAVLKQEQGVAFLGNVFYRDSVGELRRPIPNPVTFMVNRFCPERGIRSVHRKYWGLGLFSAIEHYAQAGSIITEMLDETDFIWRKQFGQHPTPRQLAARHMELHPMKGLDSLSYIDADVLLNPAKRHYRYRESDISPAVRLLLSGSVEGDIIEEHLGRYWS